MKKILLSMLCLPLTIAGFSQSADVPLVNPSFELPSDSSKIACQHATKTDTVAINNLKGFGWRIDSCNDVGREDPKKFGDPNRADAGGDPTKYAVDGMYVAYSHSTSGRLYQVTETVDKAGAKYTFSGSSIYCYNSTDTIYSCVYISVCDAAKPEKRTIVAGDSLLYLTAEVSAAPSWDEVSVSYTTTSNDIGKKIVVEFGNTTASPWGYLYHDAFSLTREGGVASVASSALSSVSIYPNPSNGKIRINGINTGTMQVIDLVGKLMYSGPISQDNQAVDLSNLSKGVYLVEIKSNGVSKTSKFVIK